MQKNKGVVIDASVRGATINASDNKKPSRPRRTGPSKAKAVGSTQKETVKIAFLGGLNEVGKNMTLYEYGGEMIVVDCGMGFPDQDMLGVDIVLPDFSYAEQNADKIKGIVVTHAHEDHIGGLPYLLRLMNVPIYGTRLTIGMIQRKLKEHGLLRNAKLNVVSPGDKIDLGRFNVECIHVNHSIPDALAFAIRCKAGTIIQTGDFKIDSTPIDGDMMDLTRVSQIGKEKVLCLLSDSTNAERPGYAVSEKKVGEAFETLFQKAEGKRIIVATFASNIHRVQQIMDVAHRLRKKVVVSGRSLENVVGVAQELGYLNIPEGLLITLDKIKSYPSDELVIITTGSQGEPMSALARMAFSDHRRISITNNDYVIISATPIPGNEKTVNKVINELLKLGADVIYEKMYDVHVSGHACQEELKILMGLVKPQYFIPVHGEQKHLQKHASLALSMEIPKENILIADNGNVIEMNKNEMKLGANVPAGRVLVDGYGVGDVGSVVLRDRKHLAQDGLVIVSATINSEKRTIISAPDIVSRGFVYVKESEQLIEKARQTARTTIETCFKNNVTDAGIIKAKLRDDISRLMYEQTKRSPMVLPVIMDVK